MGDTVSHSLHAIQTWKKYTLGGLKIAILCYFTSWFLFTFTSTNFSLWTGTKSGTHTLKLNTRFHFYQTEFPPK